MVKKHDATVGLTNTVKKALSLSVGSKSTASLTPTAQEPTNEKKHSKVKKVKKVKLVWDSFTMPAPEFQAILKLKKRCIEAGLQVKKSEILRAAVARFLALNDATVFAALRRLEEIKSDRPRKKLK